MQTENQALNLHQLVPHPGAEHLETIEADYQMKDGMLVILQLKVASL